MRLSPRALTVLCPLVLLAACGEEETVLRVNRDAGADIVPVVDAAVSDAAAPVDAEPAVDSSGTPDVVDAAPADDTIDAADDAGPDAGVADSGADVPPPACAEGDKCDDGKACTTADTCKAGVCVGGPALGCDDSDPCTDDSCDDKTGCVHLATAATCDDANACTTADACGPQGCKGKAADCDDGNACTDDLCDPKKGCQHAPNAAPCSDGNDCTLGDACDGGGCIGGKPKSCSDDNPCTTDACNAIGGACAHTSTDATCNDGNACTSNDACVAGACAGKPVSCDDGDPCTIDSCDNKAGCDYELSKGPCNDGNACTDFDKCLSGKCKGVAKEAADCDDGNACTDDGCDKLKGCVSTPNTAPCTDGNNCTQGDTCADGKCSAGLNVCDCQVDADCKSKEDGDLCNGTLFCDKSKAPFVCAINPKTVVSCSGANDSACSKTTCDKATGQCAPQAINEGKPCDADGSACTPDDACAKGKCEPGAKLDCDDKNGCTADSCDPLAGCKNVATTAACDADGNACTVGDACQDKVCIAGKAKSCDDQNGCTKDSCDPKSGQCGNDGAALDGQGCDADGSVCTPGDACQGGACVAGKALGCDDKNPCTVDSCDPKVGCVNAAAVGPCDADGDACTVGDTCQSKVCVAGAKKTCDDGDACTTDACDSKTGACSNAAVIGCGGNCQKDADCDDKNACTGDTCTAGKCAMLPLDGTPCDDGTACTVGDACAKSKCVGTQLNCDDKNPCTDDSCDPKVGCVKVNNTAGCDDKDACTVGDVCSAGSCVPGKAKICDDGDKCTADACQSGNCVFTGIPGCGGFCANAGDCDDKNACTSDGCVGGKCVMTNNTAPCDDGDGCTVNDACGGGKCQPGAAKNCDDGDLCTTGETCAAGSCVAGKPKVCDDGDKCTSDACQGGNCVFTGIPGCGGFCANAGDCDDKNVCTTDACIGGKCAYTNNTAACDDANACTVGETCAAGKCQGGTAKNCDDGNACTTDSCDAKSAGCQNVPTNQGTPCDDKNACTSSDACDGNGACAGLAKNCDDGNVCTDDACSAGKCSNTNNTALCDDGNACTFGEQCASGKCLTVNAVWVDSPAGSVAGYADGQSAAAKFNYPYGVAVDASGNMYVADSSNNVIRKVTPTGVTTTFAGSGQVGWYDAKGTQAWFNSPFGIAIDTAGNLYVADRGNHLIRKISAAGDVTTVAGTSAAGATDGPVAKATFNQPYAVAVSPGGGVFVSDTGNHRIRVIANGMVTTLAGTGAGFADGAGKVAQFNNPLGIASDGNGNVLVADQSNHRIRKITPAGVVSTFAGSGIGGILDGGVAGARFNNPWGVAIGGDGTIYIGDRYNHRIRKIYNGLVTTYAGTGAAGAGNGAAGQATFQYPAGVAVDASGYVYVADGHNHRVRRVRDGISYCSIGNKCYVSGLPNPQNTCQSCQPAGSTSQWTTASDGANCSDGDACTASEACAGGKCVGTPSTCDDQDACTKDACDGGTGLCVYTPIVGCGGNCTQPSDCDDKNACTTDSCASGKCANTANNLACDDGNACTLGDTCANGSCVAGSNVEVSTLNGTIQGYKDGAPGVAQWNRPGGLDVDAAGNVYVADWYNHVIRKIATDGSSSTIAGTGIAGYADGAGNTAQFNTPTDVKIGPGGKLYVTDFSNARIRVIAADGTVSTLAGIGGGYQDGPAAQARFNAPYCLAVTPGGAVLVGDYNNHRIRRIVGGMVTTLAGGQQGFADGTGAAAKFNGPLGVAVDSQGNAYVADQQNHRIRKVTPAGVVTTIAGTGVAGYADGDAANAQFNAPWGIAVDAVGNVLVVDRNNQRIRRISLTGVVSKVAGSGAGGAVNGIAAAATFANPIGIAVDQRGQMYIGDFDNFRVRRIVDGSKPCKVSNVCYAGGTLKPGDACQECDASKNASDFSARADGSACTDGKFCTTGDQCAGGNCNVTPVSCDDKNDCTADSCDAASGACVFDPIVGCNGYCTQSNQCDDKNGCTTDTCTNNACAFANNTLACDDGNPCTDGDTCAGGSCKPGVDATVVTLAGSTQGYADGKGAAAQFNAPTGAEVMADGTVFVADYVNHRIRKIATDGTVTTFAGSGNAGLLDGTGTNAWFNVPADIAADAKGTLYVADRDNAAIRKIDAQGVVTTLAGGVVGMVDATGKNARFNNPYSVAVTPAGVVYVADYSNHRIRKVTPQGVVTTLAGSTQGYKDGTGANAQFFNPIGVAVDGQGNVWVGDYSNHRIRKVTPDGVVTTAAGSGIAGFLDGDPSLGRFNYPWGVAVDSANNVYVADRNNHRIRKLANGVLTTVAGNGNGGWLDGVGTKAVFNQPLNLALAPGGSIVVADWGNHRIRRLRETANSCSINSACYSAQLTNPAAGCQVCDASKATTTWTVKADNVACVDGDYCTVSEVCTNGKCGGSTGCDDLDACTADSCDATTGGCSHVAIPNCP